MEEELRCFHCRLFYHVPVILHCHHALCLACASALQLPGSSSSVGGSSIQNGDETSEADKLSVLSDADSGVSCSSRPTSLVSGSDNPSSTSLSPVAYTIRCPRCDSETNLDETGAQGLARFRVLASVVDRHLERFQISEQCQLCDDGSGDSLPSGGNNATSTSPAEHFCEQCLVFYCTSCRETCHPSRGPLAAHCFMSVSEGRALIRSRRREREASCSIHANENVSMYCNTCTLPVCVLCLHNGRHHGHDVHALNAITKAHKTELSQSLQQLSEKARSATEFIHTLKQMTEETQGNCREIEGSLVAQIDALTDALQERRTQLITWLRRQRDTKIRVLREQAHEYTQTLQSTTGTIHFCIEALKEVDSSAFMENQDVLSSRVSGMNDAWSQNMNPEPRISSSFDLTLDDKSLMMAVKNLTFIQLKRPMKGLQTPNGSAPQAPTLIPSECAAENNSVTVCWCPHEHSHTSGFLLEIDDGSNGAFKEVYSGKETMCTIDGLHFNSLYKARIRAFNDAGISPYSDVLCLQTAQVAVFSMSLTHSELILSDDMCTLRCDSFEHRLGLASVGLSRGKHRWRFIIDRYDGNADVAFGLAKSEANTERILGKCPLGWSMYIDSERSWLMHNGDHFRRCKGGITAGDSVTVIFSWDERILEFYVNQTHKGSMSVGAVNGVLFPAVSLNRSITVTLETGLPHPSASSIPL